LEVGTAVEVGVAVGLMVVMGVGGAVVGVEVAAGGLVGVEVAAGVEAASPPQAARRGSVTRMDKITTQNLKNDLLLFHNKVACPG
jgi:hypothetical protein